MILDYIDQSEFEVVTKGELIFVTRRLTGKKFVLIEHEKATSEVFSMFNHGYHPIGYKIVNDKPVWYDLLFDSYINKL